MVFIMKNIFSSKKLFHVFHPLNKFGLVAKNSRREFNIGILFDIVNLYIFYRQWILREQ